MSQAFHRRHSNPEVTLVTCWNIHASASAHFRQVRRTQRRGVAAQAHARPLRPTHLSLGSLWPSSDHKDRWWGWDVYQTLHAWSYKSWIQTDDSTVVAEEEASWRAQKLTLLNVVCWGGVVEDLTTCPSAHRLSGWQPGMSAWLHCPCPCSLREVWNRQLWSDSSFQKCLWERRMKKAIRRAEMPSQMPIFSLARTSKAKIFIVEEVYCVCVRPLKSSTASLPH